MRIDVVTIFPEYLEPLRHALLGKAIEQNILQVGVHNLRQWTTDVHQSVDSTPCGGGPGMVMKPQVWGSALDDVATGTGPAGHNADLTSSAEHRKTDPEASSAAELNPADTADADKPLLIVPTPAGRPFTQDMAERWSKRQHVVFACGRYEGIDQRVIDDARNRYHVEEVSIGDYVLIGGEAAVLVMTEAMVRLIPGVLGNQSSHEDDSFQDGLLEGPSYTRPREWRGRDVPDILFSGNHAKIEQWRRQQSLKRTAERRPELLEHVELSQADKEYLSSLEE